jgi:hypothetical protein
MNVMSAEIRSGSSTQVGSRAVERVRMGPRHFDVELEVAEAEPGRRAAWRIVGGGPLTGDVVLDLAPTADRGTRATWSGNFGLTGLWRLLEPLMARELAAGEADELRRLRAVLETPTAPVSPE